MASSSTCKTAWLFLSCPLTWYLITLVVILSSQTSYTSIKMSIKGLNRIQKKFPWQDFRITPYINYACVHCLKKTKDRTILSSAIAVLRSKPHFWLDRLFFKWPMEALISAKAALFCSMIPSSFLSSRPVCVVIDSQSSGVPHVRNPLHDAGIRIVGLSR